jgi:hypothetical protein
MKKSFIVLLIGFQILSDCKGQVDNKNYDLFCNKFRLITIPAQFKFPEAIKREVFNNPIGKLDVEKYLSKKESFFYGAVDRDGYAPYKYYYGYRFRRNENVDCLLFPANRYGDQFILATYTKSGILVDSLTVGLYLVDYMGGIIQNFTIYSNYELSIEKVDAIIEKRTKYDSKEKKFNNAVYSGKYSNTVYQIDDQGKISLINIKENKNGFLNIVNDSIIWIE